MTPDASKTNGFVIKAWFAPFAPFRSKQASKHARTQKLQLSLGVSPNALKTNGCVIKKDLALFDPVRSEQVIDEAIKQASKQTLPGKRLSLGASPEARKTVWFCNQTWFRSLS